MKDRLRLPRALLTINATAYLSMFIDREDVFTVGFEKKKTAGLITSSYLVLLFL